MLSILNKSTAFVAGLLIALLGGFILTHESTPAAAELAFVEESSVSSVIGGVIPASCESSPPYSHFVNDCPTMCQLSGNPLVRNNTYYSTASNSCVCNNGKTNPPDCTLPNVQLQISNSATTPFFGVNLSVSATRSTVGFPVTVSWNVTGSGVSCATPSWISPSDINTMLPSGSKSVVYGTKYSTTDRSKSIAYSLSCTKGSETILKTVYVFWENPDYDYCSQYPTSKICIYSL